MCCELGVITLTGTKADYWVPWDEYIVQAKKDESIQLPAELQTVCDIVLSGKFQETSADCPRISYPVYHQRNINAISPPKKTKSCKCRGGKCGKGCGCRKKQASHTSGQQYWRRANENVQSSALGVHFFGHLKAASFLDALVR